MPRRPLANSPGKAALSAGRSNSARSPRSTKARTMQQDAPVTSSPTSAIEKAESATSGLNWPLLTSDACFPPSDTKTVDLAAFTAELVAALNRFTQATDDDPFSNPIQRLALELSRRIEDGSVSYATLEQLIQYLSADGFIGRAARLSRYVGEMDPDANIRILTARIEAMSAMRARTISARTRTSSNR